MRTHKSLFVAILLAAASVAVYADTKIEFKATENGGSSMNSILIGQGKIRSDADQNTTVIIDPTAGAMTTIDRGAKTFTTITRADLKQMTDLLASMPPGMME